MMGDAFTTGPQRFCRLPCSMATCLGGAGLALTWICGETTIPHHEIDLQFSTIYSVLYYDWPRRGEHVRTSSSLVQFKRRRRQK